MKKITPAVSNTGYNPTMPTWKRILLRSVGFGAGFAVVLVIVVGVWTWYRERPKPPKPWNEHAITAEYESVTTKGDENYVSFEYVLQNNTESDYRLTSMTGVDLTAKLGRTRSFAQFGGLIDAIAFPIFVPAKSRTSVAITIPYPYKVKPKSTPTREERDKYNSDVEQYVKSEFPNFDGLVLFDSSNHYKIDFPSGRTQGAKPSSTTK